MDSDSSINTLLTNNNGGSEGNCRSKPLVGIVEHIELIKPKVKDEIRNFIIDELIYRLKDMYLNISSETINMIADEVVAAIDNIVCEADNSKNIDELIENEKTYSTLAVTSLMIIKNREADTIEISEVDLIQIMKTIIKNVLTSCILRV